MRIRIRPLVRLTAPVLALSLAACATGPYQRSAASSQEAGREARQYLKQMQDVKKTPPRQVVRVHHGQWINPIPVKLSQREQLPGLGCEIRFEPHLPVTIGAFAQIVARTCHLSIKVTTDARRKLDGDFDKGGKGGRGRSTANTSAGRLPPLPGLPLPGGAVAGGQQTIDLDYRGPLDGLLDRVAMQLGLNWRVDDGGVTFFFLESRIYTLYALPGKTTLSTSVQSGTTAKVGVSGGGGGGSGGGNSSNGGVSGSAGTTQKTDVSLTTDIRGDLEKAIKSMLTPGVGRMAFAGSTGTIIVTDRPAVLDTIGQFIGDQNHVLTKQVVLNIRVMSVTLSRKDSFGINWSMVYNAIDGRNGVSLTNVVDAGTGAIGAGVSILKGPFAGTKLLVNALAQQGAVSTITSPSVTTLNMQPVPVQVARQTGYLAEVSTSQVAQVGSSTSLTPGMVTDGFNMNLLPQIIGDTKTLLLQFSINLSKLDNLRKAASGGNEIEIPEVSNRAFSQRVKLRSGETLVLSGFQQLGHNTTYTGAGSPHFWLFGGGRSRNDSRQVLVVLITPIITG